jgi:hypothetical protein
VLIYNFEEFILENKSLGFPFHLSEAMLYILSSIDGDPIAKELLHLNKLKEFKNYTLIDTEFKEDYVTFVPGKILRDTVYSELDDENLRRITTQRPLTPASITWYKGRNPIKIGRLVNILFPNKFTSDQVETFVNKFKSKNQKIKNHFEIYKSIPMAYNTQNYSNKYGKANQLWNSCMNDLGDYIFDLYTHNDNVVECLTLMEDEVDKNAGKIIAKIIGRALIWKTKDGELFMDRVYYIHEKDYYKFIDFAKENRMTYRSKNKSGDFVKYIKNGIEFWKPFVINIKYPIESYEFLPYLDTFCYAQDKRLTNYTPKGGSYYKLNNTMGKWETYKEVE